MKKGLYAGICALAALLAAPGPAGAVTKAEDIAATIMLRGYACGGRAVSDIHERKDKAGGTVITATCPNGRRYRIEVTPEGRVRVTPLR